MSPLSPLGRVSVAILSCNRREELRITLRGLLERGPLWGEIIVADNASTDGTPAMVRREFPEVRLIETGGNLGVAGLNQAYRAARGEWVLSLDDDSCPELGTFGPLATALATGPDFAAITCSVRARPTCNEPGVTAPVLAPYAGFHEAGGLLRRELIERLGGLDEDLFLWGVETHLTARALLAGFKLARCDSAVVVHRATPLNRSSRRHAYHYCRNLFLFILRHAPIAMAGELTERFLGQALLYSALHRTTAYIGAVRAATRMHRVKPVRAPLGTGQFQSMAVDLRAPFSFLG
ncbi:MAG TPA: glycosyltransferase [Opitutaceae bacterium]|nr:glycosyltransferase [Opitutaceae bacterium]